MQLNRMTKKKVRLQLNQCTYTDLDCLFSFSNDLSVDFLNTYLNYLAQIWFVCSSTLVYLMLSSLFVSNYLLFVRDHLLSSSSSISLSVTLDENASNVCFNQTRSSIELIDRHQLTVSQVPASNGSTTSVDELQQQSNNIQQPINNKYYLDFSSSHRIDTTFKLNESMSSNNKCNGLSYKKSTTVTKQPNQIVYGNNEILNQFFNVLAVK